jgi:hypothetical protein
MDVSIDGLNDTPLLAPVLESDNPPLPLGAQREKPELSKNGYFRKTDSYPVLVRNQPIHL